jgi:hypothetical protein
MTLAVIISKSNCRFSAKIGRSGGCGAYQGTFDVEDLLGNRIIRLAVQNQSLLDPHRTQQFKQYFEVNEFENRDTRFAGEQFNNLVFKWEPQKVVFADGTKIEAAP